MISAQQIQGILAQYQRHGWLLRRVLLSAPTREGILDSFGILFGETPVTDAEVDAVWFSRPSGIGREAWELRRLSGSPFALVEVFDEDDDETVREEALFEMEQTLISGRRQIDDEY